MNKKLTAASLSIALTFGAFSGVMTPANAANVVVTQDGWGLRAKICSWMPFWC